MRARYLLGLALATAMAVAACGEDTDQLLDGIEGESGSIARKPGKAAAAPAVSGPNGTTPSSSSPSGPVATNSPEGKAFFKASVHPFMAQACGTCHDVAGPGPNWLTVADAEKSYAQLFSQGYVIAQSRVTTKPAHGGVTTNALSGVQVATYNQWVGMELKDGGAKAPPQILEKLGTCFDRAKFDAMQMGQWRTTQRTANNNTNAINPWNENANNCTGCNNAPCSTCHSADPATNFNNAVGSPLLPPETTFENTKLTAPAYISKFFGVSPDGKPVASDGIKKKSDATKKDKAYTHPMYTLNANQQTALDAFVTDAITKFAAGTCGK
jgi:hypothetical protein